MLVQYKLSQLVQTMLADSLGSDRLYAGPGVTCSLDVGLSNRWKLLSWLIGQKRDHSPTPVSQSSQDCVVRELLVRKALGPHAELLANLTCGLEKSCWFWKCHEPCSETWWRTCVWWRQPRVAGAGLALTAVRGWLCLEVFAGQQSGTVTLFWCRGRLFITIHLRSEPIK